MEAVVLYPFDSSKDEEISVVAGEVVSVVGVDDGSGWIRVKANDDRHGFMPLSYLEIQEVSC